MDPNHQTSPQGFHSQRLTPKNYRKDGSVPNTDMREKFSVQNVTEFPSRRPIYKDMPNAYAHISNKAIMGLFGGMTGGDSV